MIAPEKIAKGMMLTLYEWTHRNDNSYKGSILEVKEVQLPFIVVNERHGFFKGNFTLDTRQATFMELSQEFVDALESKNTA